LAAAADRVATTDERLSEYFRRFCAEETGHELLCIKDLDALGENVERVLSGDLNPGVFGMITQCYYWASHGDPAALLGDAFATEELGVARGLQAAKVVEATLDIPGEATNSSRSMGAKMPHTSTRQRRRWSGMQAIAIIFKHTLCDKDDLQELWTAIHRRFGTG
jgi:hypothetical protein